MWNYEKRLEYPIKIKQTNPTLAAMIISQYGGPYFNKVYCFPSYLYVHSITDILNVQYHYILSMLCTSIALVTVLPIPITARFPLTWITSYSS
jgi:hypothetical protein